MFVTYQGDLLGRFDPNYIKNISYVNNINTLYSLVPLGSLLTEQPMYGANEMAIDGDPQTEVRYIRITDIDNHGKLQNEDWKTAKRVDQKYALDENDILFARSGATAGKTFIYKSEYGKAIFAGYMIRFRFDRTKVNPLFVFYYTLLSRYRRWVRIIQRPSGQPNINSREFKSFELPLAPLDIQNHIVEIMQSAYAQKRQKDQEADTLWDSIDDYMLAELGIEMPVVEEKKCFVVYANETVGRRIDSYYHSPYFKQLYSAINNYGQIFSLGSLVSEIDYGLMPTQDYADSGDTGIPMIRVTNLLPEGSIDMSEVKYIPFDTPRLDLKRVKADDILMVQCGNTTGKTALVPKHFEGYTFGSFLFVIRGKREIINQHYLFAILSNRLIQEQVRHTWNIVTVRPNTSKPNVKNLLIPVPPFEIQTRIAEEVMNRKSEAAALKQEANAIVESAKREVEQILLEKES